MAKLSTQYICQSCGHTQQKWEGKCPSCGEWNSLSEDKTVATQVFSGGRPGAVVKLGAESGQGAKRVSSGLAEVDLVLGGGVVPGSLVLLGGDPGVGKSTLALQVALAICEAGEKVLYVSGEESVRQVGLRADRIGSNEDLLVLSETDLETIVATLEKEKPRFAVVDSIQTMFSSQVNGVIGGVSQVAYATNALLRVAKNSSTALVLIGHVTKEGVLAGPRTLEHMVDTVLYLEGERFDTLRLLRCVKNRFGGTGEVGVFDMQSKGLVEVKNPGGIFLEHRTSGVPGTCVAAILEGNKVLLLEVQALTNPTSFGYPKRTASGFDANRLQLLVAIMEKRLGVKLGNLDIYINVAGGFKLEERAADLPVVLAILSSVKNKAVPQDLVAFGEVGLAGEVRSVTKVESRVKESQKLGFSQVVCPETKIQSTGVQLKPVKYINFLSDLLL